jgi:glycosyltransferase involved in cell wall biosynthesis
MILFYLPNLRPGGAENVMVQLLVYFHQNGKEVGLLLGKREGELLSRIPADIPVYELGAFRARNAILKLIRFCRKNPPDYIFTGLGASVSAAWAKRFIPKNIKLVTRMASTLGAEKEFIAKPFKQFFYLFANGAVAKASDLIICQSRYMADDYKKELGKKLEPKLKVIYNPINPERAIRLAEAAPEETYDLVGIGRLVTQKDYRTMIKAVHELKKRGWTQIRLAIIGEGFKESSLRKQVRDLGLEQHVFFLGFTANPFSYLKRAKMLLSSSLYEGFSNVIIESLVLGIPVVATDCPSGNREVIQPGINGLLCELKNPLDMAIKIEEVLNHPQRFDSEKIAAEAGEKYHFEKIGREFLEVFR